MNELDLRAIELPNYFDNDAEYAEIAEKLERHLSGQQYPFRISSFGFWVSPDDSSAEDKDERMYGGFMLSQFRRDGSEDIVSTRSNYPVPDMFTRCAEMRSRLVKSGSVVGFVSDWDKPTHVFEINRPTMNNQPWLYSVFTESNPHLIALYLKLGPSNVWTLDEYQSGCSDQYQRLDK